MKNSQGNNINHSKQPATHKNRPEVRDDLDSRSEKDAKAKEKANAKAEKNEDLDEEE